MSRDQIGAKDLLLKVLTLLLFTIPVSLLGQNLSSASVRPSGGDSTRAEGETKTRMEIRATRINGGAPEIDGIVDESVWETAEVISEFSQREPKEGAPATERTEVRILYDHEALYVSARMFSDHPESIVAAATRRDQLGLAETFILGLDPFLDRKTAYSFGVTAAGVKQDYYHPIDEETKSRDTGFNPVWEARTSFDSLGWVAELRIPYSQLRFHDQPVHTWGVNLNRYIPSRNEDTYWRLRRNRDTGWSSLFGYLVGIESIKQSERRELLPYGSSRARFTGSRDPKNPFDDGRNLRGGIGADLKMGLGTNLTLDGTVNPDFGQVDADPAVVNLTAFEVVFPERRPFFVEGNRLLSNTGQEYYFSRRIGAPPHVAATGTFVDQPENTTILAAAKVSGKLPSGLSIGALTAVTERERAGSFDVATNTESSVNVEPLTGYGVLRLEQEFGPYVSTAGVVVTVVRRSFTDVGLSSILARQAYTGGVNWNLRFEGGMYELSGDAGYSYVAGDPLAIERLQRGSAHYFQRPDATYATLDATRKSLTGYTGTVAFDKKGGANWLWGAKLSSISPGFELNDMGRLSSADELDVTSNVHYRETLPSAFLHNFDFGIAGRVNWNFEKVRQVTSVTLSGRVTWKNFWRTTIDATQRFRALSDNLTRGGPLMGTAAGRTASMTFSNGVAARTKLSLAATYGTEELGGWNYEFSGTLAPKLADSWELSMNPRYSRSIDSRQYVTSIANGRPETYGRRYVFSFIERSTFAVQFRLNHTFHPDLSLEIYAEPFASSGRYYGMGELLLPKSRDLLVYGTAGTTLVRNLDGSLTITEGIKTFNIANRDFNVRSLRSNVVLRWEWRLGSTLYVIWQQSRFSTEPQGDLVGARDVWESLTVPGDNILALKASYWIPVD